ncbi:MAG: TadE/TadG family type IV pilus assembly protein [Roseateles sp.]|uniref:TadE/TadG family type IV pilus assembly protein n=1 Tax=Roseateles sp. TaxID=1971397 RepID=UPI0039E89CBB
MTPRWGRPGRGGGQGGQSATEFLIVFPLLIMLVLGVIQWGLLYQARAVLNHASLLAARAGAVHHGDKGEMKKALAAGLTPLFASEASMAGFVAARTKAFTEISVSNLASIDVLNPTAQAFTDFGQARLDGLGGGDREIPNDTLNFRNPAPGASSGVSVQDANILHVRVSYCYRLIVPVVGRMIHAAVHALPLGHALQAHGMGDPFGIGGGPLVDSCMRPMVEGPRIRIQSEAVVRMQSPFYRSNL